MAEEFTINSSAIETKINQLLPSQGGFAPGVDFSASTMVIPIVDLTESAEGSQLRQDLQTSLSLNSITSFNVSNTTSTLINNTGYFRVFGIFSSTLATSAAKNGNFSLTDGTTTKIIQQYIVDPTSGDNFYNDAFDFIVFLQAGDSLTATSSIAELHLTGCTRQIATLSGNLVNPS